MDLKSESDQAAGTFEFLFDATCNDSSRPAIDGVVTASHVEEEEEAEDEDEEDENLITLP